MGFLDKLFSKKEKITENKTEERITIDKPYGKLYYLNNPNTDEYGYEGYVDWYPNDNDEEGLDVFIDADTPDTTEAGLCMARFEKLFADKERIVYELKKNVADFFLFKPEYLREKYSEEELMKYINFVCLGVFRNGNTEFSFDICHIYADDVHIVLKSDGSKLIKYTVGEYEDRKECCDEI